LKNYSGNQSEVTIEEGLIHSQVSVAYRDKKQVEKLKKEVDTTAAGTNIDNKQSFFSRMFTRNSTVRPAAQD
jgi:hypothetical protein